MDDSVKVFLPIITLCIGTIFGYWVNKVQYKYKISLVVLDKFLSAKEEICDKLSELASINIGEMLNEEKIKGLRNDIHKLFYKYYDYYPTEVVQELTCLHACLLSKTHKLYICNHKKLSTVRTKEELERFIENISLFTNTKTFSIRVLESNNLNKRSAAAISFQARAVLTVINRHFTNEKMMELVKGLGGKL